MSEIRIQKSEKDIRAKEAGSWKLEAGRSMNSP
jgi:hypothetical protein